MSLKLFSFPVFLISFSIGVLVVYLTSPPPREIMVYPTPENVGDLLYRDKAQSCFRFTPKEVQCPKDETHIKKVGPQTK
jgi:hypothetical protein